MMETSGAFRQNGRWTVLLDVFAATDLIDDRRVQQLISITARVAAVNAAQLADAGLSGPALGQAIRARRLQLISDTL